MILTTIIIVLVLTIAFFHYTQGFFSATISAMLAIISAVLAFSLHERIVESFLGGRFSDTAHGITLAVLFAVIYLVLRVAFDAMVPGNVRFPVIVDKVGGAAMGLIAGIFAGGIVAIVAQYMPLMPSVAGYSRYAVDTRTVVVPAEATGRRSLDSEEWDKLKGEKPGQFEPADRQSMIIPMDDIVVGTVNHLSEGGSLAWDKPLSAAHPDFLQELFAQRLGVQTKANRVATKDAVAKDVELFRADSLQRRDHEYKELRDRPLDTTPLRPTPNQVLLVVRVMFGRGASDSDGLVKFSPAMVRLVTRQGTGAGAQWVDYYPIGTVDKAQVLYGSSLDDFLFIDAKGADKGADFAFLVDKSGFAEGGQSGPLVVSDGTFIEIKRMARQDLSRKQIKTPDKYKASENIQVMRKKQAEATPAPTAAAPGADLKDKLVGSWGGTSDAGELIIEFKADGTLSYTNKPKTGTPQVGEGKWTVVPEKTTADTLVINRTVGSSTNENTIKFNGDSSLTLTSGTNPPRQLTKR